MLDRFIRILGAVVLAVATFAVVASQPAAAALGETAREAEPLENDDFTGFGVVGPGKSRWFRVDYPGSGVDFGITFHFRLSDQTYRDQVEIHVNTRTDEEWRVEDTDADAPGLTRIGSLTTVEEDGPGRKFWLNFRGDATTYFLRVENKTNRTIGFGLSVLRDGKPARYTPPPDFLDLREGQPLVSTRTMFQPTPTPERYFPENPSPTIELAEELPNDDYTLHAQIGPGTVRWYKVEYPGGDTPLGFTLHLNLNDTDVVEKVNVQVNTPIGEDTQGEHDKDVPGYSRLGTLTLTDDQVVIRKFWVNSLDGPTTYYLRVNNDADYTVTFALSIRQSLDPAEWVSPGD